MQLFTRATGKLSDRRAPLCLLLLFSIGLPVLGQRGTQADEPESRKGVFAYSFALAADMRSFVGPAPAGKRYFDGACEALRDQGPGEFMLGPGDCDPPGPVRATIDRYLGTNYLWYPVTGNHETEKSTNMVWLRAWGRGDIPFLVRRGPPGSEYTTYSFDFGNSHVVMLNEYFDGTSDAVRGKDDLPESMFRWLEQDLQANRQPLIWVVGHKPLLSLPDMDSGRVRHGGESVSTNKVRLARLIKLLKQYRVRAYICGHTHNTSVAKVMGIWQLDTGHARGGGDKGAPSTFMKVRVDDKRTWVDVFRADPSGSHYSWRLTRELES